MCLYFPTYNFWENVMKNKLTFVAAFLISQMAFGQPAVQGNVGDTAVAVAGTQGARTQINWPTTIRSVHGVTLYNTTPGFKDFQWTVSLCPETQPEHCKIIKEHIGLATGQSWGHTYNLEVNVAFHAVGTKPITARTVITGGASDTASDTKYVDVHY
jgi:hypothetical protein